MSARRKAIGVISLALMFLLLGANVTTAFRVIYVADDRVMSWGEGYYRQNPLPGDYFVREADPAAPNTLLGAWVLLWDFDDLIIMAHGHKGLISLEGAVRSGFGAGTGAGGGCPPYVLPVSDAVAGVDIKSCYSAADPDGDGPQISVVESLEPLLPFGFVTGYADRVMYGFCPSWRGGTDAQRQEALRCLGDQAAADGYAGPNRVNDWLRDQSYEEHQNVQSVIDACRNAGRDVGDVEIVFTYGEPRYQTLGLPVSSVWVSLGDEPDSLAELECFYVSPCTSCCGPSQTESTTWGGVKAIYR